MLTKKQWHEPKAGVPYWQKVKKNTIASILFKKDLAK
jgi:hypothetical protein